MTQTAITTWTGRRSPLLFGAMHLPLGRPLSWPYASGSDKNSVGRFLGSVQFGLFHGRLSCWEATGAARREFADNLGLEVAQYLDCNSELSESGSYFHMSLYMVGKSTSRAKPTVMFVSGDARVRKDAFKTIKQSGILAAYPGFALAHIPLETEYKNFRQLAGGGPITASNSAGTTPGRVFTTKHGSYGGRRLYFDGFGSGVDGNGQRHMATAGGVISFRNTPMFITVCHAAEPRSVESAPEGIPRPETYHPADEGENCEECGITGFDAIDLVSQESEDDLVVTTSRGSATPESSHSTSDDGSVFSAVETVVSDPSPSAIRTNPKSLVQVTKNNTNTAIPAGEVVLSSSDLDCLLIRVHPEMLPNQKEQGCIPLEEYSAFVEVGARDAAIRTTTPDGGTIEGTLSGTPSFVRLPFSKKFQQVYTARFQKPLVAGDCGSWVKDATTGKLFGHIIAGSPTTGLVTIIPAHRVFAHLLSELGRDSKLSAQPCWGSIPLQGSNNQPITCPPLLKRESGKASSIGGLGRLRSLFKRPPRGKKADGEQAKIPVVKDSVASQSDTPTNSTSATAAAVSSQLPTSNRVELEDTSQPPSHPAYRDSAGSENREAAQDGSLIPPSPPHLNLSPMPITINDAWKTSKEKYDMPYPELRHLAYPTQSIDPSMDFMLYDPYPEQSSSASKASGSVFADSPFISSYMSDNSSPELYVQVPSSSLSIATASSSHMGNPMSNHGQLGPIPEWAPAQYGLSVSPGIIEQNEYYPSTDYSFVPCSLDSSSPNFDFANANMKRFVDPSLIHPDVKRMTRFTGGQQPHSQPNFAFPASPPLTVSPHPPSNNTSPFIHNNDYRPYSPFSPFQSPLVSLDSNFSGEQTDSGYNTEQKQRCPHPDCGKVFKDLKAHMLTHQIERPEKCPIKTCDYHVKGFAKIYDKNRHTLTHYKGTMVCGFCPGSGTASERAFNRADVFKRHLTAVHGVDQTPPNSRKRALSNLGGGSTNKKLTDYAHDATGKCSTCPHIFTNAQDFYEHLDDCVLRVVQQGVPPDDRESPAEAHDTLEELRLPTPATKTTADEDSDDDMDEEMVDDDPTTRTDLKPSIPPTNQCKGNPPNGVQKSRGLTPSRGGVSLPTNTRKGKKRRDYSSSWGDKGQITMKKRVIAVFEGERRLTKDDMILSTEHEVRVKLADGKSYVTNLDVQTTKRVEGFLGASTEEKGSGELPDEGRN